MTSSISYFSPYFFCKTANKFFLLPSWVGVLLLGTEAGTTISDFGTAAAFSPMGFRPTVALGTLTLTLVLDAAACSITNLAS